MSPEWALQPPVRSLALAAAADAHSNSYWDWVLEHLFVLYPAQALAAEQLQTFNDFPPRQDPAAFNLEGVMKAVVDASGSGLR